MLQLRCFVCRTFASIKTVYHIAPPQTGKTNGVVTSPRQCHTEKPLQNAASGIAHVTERAPTGEPTTEQSSTVQPHKRPDYRQPHNRGKTYYCLKRFMGSFEQSGCCRFILDPNNHKCLYQTFTGTCDRGGDD
jgi:hypothetical protein